MSGLGELALIMEAFRELPEGTTAERTAYIQRRKRELAQGQGEPPRVTQSPVKPFSAVADDPVIARLAREDTE